MSISNVKYVSVMFDGNKLFFWLQQKFKHIFQFTSYVQAGFKIKDLVKNSSKKEKKNKIITKNTQ